MGCTSSSSNSRNATRTHTFWFRNPAHEEIAFAHEEKQNAHEEIAFAHEQKRNAREEITFAHEEKQNAHEEIAFPDEEKGNAHEESAFPHEADPVDAVMAQRDGWARAKRCAKLRSR